MAYVAVKGGERAIDAAHAWLAAARRGDPAVPLLDPAQIDQQLGRAVDRVMAEGSLLRPRAGGAGDQAGAGRPGRGDLPAARLPHHPAALRRQRAGRHRRDAGAAPHLGDLQGPARRPGARPDLRLHAPPARFRAQPTAPPAAGTKSPRRAGAPMPPRLRHPRPRRPDRARPPRRARPHPATSPANRSPSPPPRDVRLQTLARGDEGFLLALGYSTQRGYGGTHPFVGEIRVGEVEVEIDAAGAGLRDRDRRDRC